MKIKNKDLKCEFAKLLKESGLSAKVIDELYNWYDCSKHKGVASF